MKTTNQYLNEMHKLGRIGGIGAILIMLGIPTVAAIAYDAFPTFSEVLLSSIGLIAIFVPIAISEVLSFTPVLGSSIYLTLITGNLMNLKLPTVLNAFELTKVEQGNEEGDIISGIAVATSSIITIIVIALGVLFITPLKPVMSLPAVQTASTYLLPALFGGLSIGTLRSDIGGGIKIKGRLKAAVLPVILIAVLYFVSPVVVESLQGVLIIIAFPVIYGTARYLYKRGKIIVTLPEDTEAEQVA